MFWGCCFFLEKIKNLQSFFASPHAVNVANSLKLLWEGISIAMNRHAKLLSGSEMTAQYLSQG